jgi:hypothetical protein
LPHESDVPAVQTPSPSQRAACLTVDPLHDCAVQIAPAA